MNNDRFSRSNINTPFHSSGYAQVSQGNTIGSTNGQSFDQRVRIEKTRSSVAGYRQSLVGQNYIHQDARSGNSSAYESRPAPSVLSRRKTGYVPPARSTIAHSQPQRSFVEPPTRYNPYG